MKFGVVVFPGSNCDHDMYYAFNDVLGKETQYLWHKEESLNGFTSEDCILIPGGFSYGDYLRAGAIARFSPIMKAVMEFANEGGKVFGVCNGFQILCETGLLPGVLLQNDHQKFISQNAYLKKKDESLITKYLQDDELVKIPIAHADGRFFAKDETLSDIVSNGQILFQYCDTDGNVSIENNPNGSLMNIAGVSNKDKNVFGMMPHPERAIDEALFNTDGLKILQGLVGKETALG